MQFTSNSINGIQIIVFDIMLSKERKGGEKLDMSIKLSTTMCKFLFS